MKRAPYSFFLFFLLVAVPAAWARDIEFESGPETVPLVQLFTNDSNAACNAALAWMNRQAVKDPGSVLWKKFIPVAMHVRLWDADGYKDAMAKLEFDDMLTSYKSLWGSTKLYPPTVVVNAVEWSGWSRDQDVPPSPEKPPGVLQVKFEEFGKVYTVIFKPSKELENASFTVHGALVSFGTSSRPADGKNRGKVLQHDFLVTVYRKTDLRRSSDAEHLAQLEMAKPPVRHTGKYAVVFWVTKTGSHVPVQSAGSFLP